MDQDIEIINTNTRIEKVKNFLLSYKKHLIAILLLILLGLFSFFYYQDYKSDKKKELAYKYNLAQTNFKSDKKENTKNILIEIINSEDSTYSPLAFYFLLDNDLISSKQEINNYFDKIINDVDLDKEIKNLIIFKKGLFNSDFANENDLLNILNPVIKSESIWKSHALYLMGEYYISKNQKQKSKEFFEKIINLENVNSKIKIKAQNRIRSDISE
tara:strand:- start:1855 stop:2499 length:645 start_codon:yes stop_codon:yes gene_type:complete